MREHAMFIWMVSYVVKYIGCSSIAALSSIRTNLSPFTKGCRDRGASMRVHFNFFRGFSPTGLTMQKMIPGVGSTSVRQRPRAAGVVVYVRILGWTGLVMRRSVLTTCSWGELRRPVTQVGAWLVKAGNGC